MNIDQTMMILIGMGVVALLLIGVLVLINNRSRMDSEERRIAADKTADTIASVMQMNAGLEARIKTMAESHAMQQEELKRTMHERLDAVGRQVGKSLNETNEKTGESLEKLKERLAVIDEAQKNITDLSGQMVGLQDILSNKQARGAFGEIQLNDLVSAILPPSAYEFQATLENKARVDCLIKLPNPPGSIAVDAKFPLESYHRLGNAETDQEKKQAQSAFKTDILKHVKDISEKYIIHGETAESALMFLPSEAVYAELHSNFSDVVEKSYRAKVWIVSPTTLMATLNTVRAVLKDARMRDQAGIIQKHVMTLMEDMDRLDQRIGNLRKHFDQADKDISQIETSSRKIQSKADTIEKIQLEEVDDIEDGIEPKPAAPVKLLVD
ncbi:DNA recombination protein RmuC [Pseudemcibacter aquimaris]|uniref:DNA recombination protein RmuC n=1 Tax=Pseudemcibacter aquimaris TaxID=2857064 RepID=UPI0020118F19|nr:DNA recombination protein RmuC [Pseudemcibacter aquimaris]MCC3861393.1 DNA recombination protein RmuC [Pseudemcibacter aquimaris]WDU58163.1 DNA recombination protein RmuC [Pseudemcibacter aquimaris]